MIKLKDSFHILAIGNSFSVDAMEYLAQVANNLGYKDVVLGNLYIGGCSIDTHVNNCINNLPLYTYYKTTNGNWDAIDGYTVLEGLKDEDWDVITMQQASGSSGVSSTYDNLYKLVDYVNLHKNRKASLVWYMTWAYQQDSTHAEFVNYYNSQYNMYQAIINSVNERIVKSKYFDLVIPTGVSIQLARKGYIGDTLTRDGFHLSYQEGRFLASITWFKALTGCLLDKLTYNPDSNKIDDKLFKFFIDCATEACENNPFN